MERTAVVTGEACGLGRAISAMLLADGVHVVGLDINAPGLAGMAEPRFTRHVIDLTDSAAISAVSAQIGQEQGDVVPT